MGWVAFPLQQDDDELNALARTMKDKEIGPVWIADAVRLNSGLRVSHQRISQIRSQAPPTGCRLDVAEQISKALDVPLSLMWRVTPTNEATRKLSDQRVSMAKVRNSGARSAQRGRRGG